MFKKTLVAQAVERALYDKNSTFWNKESCEK